MRQLLFAGTTAGTVTSTAIATMPSSLVPSTAASSSSSSSSSASSSSSSSSSSSNPKPKSRNNARHSSNSNNSHSHFHSLPCNNCNYSPSATIDLLIFLLVLFSCGFLLSSYLSYIFNSLSLFLAQSPPQFHQFPISFLLGFLLFFAASVVALGFFCFGARSLKCEAPGCRGLKKAMEFDLKLQTEENLKRGSDEIDKIPWKGGREGNPDYECLRSELRKMAPTNGRAVLLFRARCGCPIAKLEGWGPKKGKRHKKSPPNATLKGGGRGHR